MRTAAFTTSSQEPTRQVASPTSPNRPLRPMRKSSAPPLQEERPQNAKWRSHHHKEPTAFWLFRRLVDFENLVGGNVSQYLNDATGPANLYPIDLRSEEHTSELQSPMYL